ncbi:MAG: 50S ribosomal protein L6 [Candidatus Parcubacteria bacterium]|nr:50S ribosomal protein L6 [Candidatus Parcubacteria bacterium]
MSRIGKKLITVPEGVEVKISDNLVTVKGPKGELTQKIHSLVKVELQNKEVIFTVKDPEDKTNKSLWGLYNRLVNNMIVGVTKGFEKKLEVIGVGFKVALQGQKLILNLGFSHPVEYLIPPEMTASVEKNTITLKGYDKYLVGETAARIRRIKKPEPYKGKGIRYLGSKGKKGQKNR